MSATGDDLLRLAQQAGAALRERACVLTCAESCTAGGAAFAVTQVAGSSAWFDRGFVVYSNQAKTELLGVAPELLRQHGAVSEPTAIAMALGALRHSTAQAALAVTGIAGPEGGTLDKPVGMVCFAWALRTDPAALPRVQACTRYFEGDRAGVRTQAIAEALRGLCALLQRA